MIGMPYQTLRPATLSGALRSRLLRVILAVGLGATLALLPLGAAALARLSLTINSVDHSGFPWVVTYLTVNDDKGYPILGLDRGNYEVTEDGVAVSAFEVTPMVNSQERLAVTVVVDVSGSMDARAMEDAKNAAATFINGLGEQDQASLMAFSTQVRQVRSFTGDKGPLLQAVNGLAQGGNTALYDALFAAVDAAAQSPIARKIVVLETDGYDTSSKANLEDGINLARQKGVPVYTIGLGKEIDKKVLTRIADSTGGTALFAPTSGDLEQAYHTITDQLRNQYVLKYLSPAPKGAKSYKLVVKVSQLLDKASAETIFNANPVPPVITGFSLSEGAVLTEPTTVSTMVQSAQPVKEVRLEVNGQRLAQISTSPYSFTLQPQELSSGRQQVTVTVIDSAGSTANKRVWITVPTDVGRTATPPTPPTSQTFPTLPAVDLNIWSKVEGTAQNIQVGIQDAAHAFQAKIQATKERVWGGVLGAVQRVQRFFTEDIPGFIQYHQRTLLLLIVMLSALIVLVFESRKLLGIARQRLQWMSCPQCMARYRAYQDSCPRCWTEQLLAQQQNRDLGELLVENNLLDRHDLEVAMAVSVATGKPLEEVLLEEGKVDAVQMGQARFYLGHSIEMTERRQELLASSSRGNFWDTRVLGAPLAFSLLAFVIGSVSSAFLV